MKVAILDYGAGNLHSLAKAVAGTDCSVTIEADAAKTLNHDALILPGVGAFGLAAQSIAPHIERLRDALDDGFPCLGICLGMQLLFDRSEEGEGRGIGVIPGRVRRLRAAHVPQIGWNDIEERNDEFYDASGLSSAYFANSFVCEPDDMSSVTAWTTHESDRFAASVKSGSVVGVQFHPEKSSLPGVAFIDAFLQGVRR
jgi:imidazole glycerol-phosphate synthase subunit HisH